jgi:glycosyltransferase involved in cell wall biosynthesis
VKIAIFSTHPIQYQVPWFRKLASQPELDLKVYYANLPDREQQGVGFGVPFSWDIPLLEGYEWEALANRRRSSALGTFLFSSTPGLKRVLRKAGPQAAILTGWNSLSLLQALRACVSLNIPRIVRGDSNSMRRRPLWTRVAHRLLLSRYSAFLAVGRSNRDFYLEYGTHPERVFDCPHFVDNERFQDQHEAAQRERVSIRAGWDIPEDRICFLFVGKLQPKKRITDLLNAIDTARLSNPAVHLLVSGDGELMTESAALVRDKKLPVTFTGFLNQTEITRAYAAADCLVLPSDYGETWGLVVNEAMACGLPAIVSDRVGCGPDLIDEGSTGFIVPFGDIHYLAKTLIHASADPAKLRSMGANAKKRISDYSVDRAVQGTLEAIDFVVSRAAIHLLC